MPVSSPGPGTLLIFQSLKIESAGFLRMIDEDPASGALLFRRLAEMLGNRLLDLYPTMA